MAEVLAAELRADAGLLRQLQHLGLELADRGWRGRARCRASGRSSRERQLASLTVFSVISADVPPMTIARWYGGQAAVPSVRIFSSRNASSDFGFSSAFVSWNRNVLLAEPPPLVTKRKWYSSPPVGVELDLRRQVRAGVHLVVHVERRELRVAQVGPRVGVEDAARERRLVVAARPDALALLADDDRGAGVLARRQHHAGRDVGVLQHVEGDEAVVRRRLGVVEDRAQLRQVAGAEEMRDVAHRLGGEARQGRRRRRSARLAAEACRWRRSRRRGAGTASCRAVREHLLEAKLGHRPISPQRRGTQSLTPALRRRASAREPRDRPSIRAAGARQSPGGAAACASRSAAGWRSGRAG